MTRARRTPVRRATEETEIFEALDDDDDAAATAPSAPALADEDEDDPTQQTRARAPDGTRVASFRGRADDPTRRAVRVASFRGRADDPTRRAATTASTAGSHIHGHQHAALIGAHPVLGLARFPSRGSVAVYVN